MAVDPRLKILVVDDSAAMRRVLCTLLRRLGFAEASEAADGEQALKRLRAETFGLVFSDWTMAPMTGIELLRAIRADADLAAIPFIMVTAETRPGMRAEAERDGVSGYLLKPFDAEALKAKMAGVLGPF